MLSVFDAYPMTLQRMRAAGPPVLPAAQLLSMGLHVLDGLLFLQANRVATTYLSTSAAAATSQTSALPSSWCVRRSARA
jgi:hypothetical protein